MKFEIGAALLAAFALGACSGLQGNPNGQPYATDAGGTVAVAPQAFGMVSYDPYGKAPTFADMDIGSSAIMPSSPPGMGLTPQGAAPMRPGRAPR